MSARLNTAQPYVIGLFRIVVGLLFACHGAASLFGVLGGAVGTNGGTVDAGAWPGWYAAVIQLVGGTLVLFGLGTRAAAFIASGSMAYAYFEVHQSNALWPMENGGEASAMFCWAFLLLVFTGSGALGLDRLFAKRTTRTTGEREPAAQAATVAA
ncbi:DoxX family protein [Streptomyces sp. NBC_01275]|uniref:DoxX family protein n=1 Tax=Streptomyces sp. NBC_01275 TaxID=2903807 RepID=UPI00224F5B73|nr:DoxX family protein [Streptomyces sp. NBC_01275]MCX4761635.1 DoxX family protein [Streptomyces sp. NBC_01275]